MRISEPNLHQTHATLPSNGNDRLSLPLPICRVQAINLADSSVPFLPPLLSSMTEISTFLA
jgi:hypothetical protein